MLSSFKKKLRTKINIYFSQLSNYYDFFLTQTLFFYDKIVNSYCWTTSLNNITILLILLACDTQSKCLMLKKLIIFFHL